MSNVQKTNIALNSEFTAQMSAEELRALWQSGVESGAGRFASIGEIKKEAGRRTAKTS